MLKSERKMLTRESPEGKTEYLGSFETEERKVELIEKDRKTRAVLGLD
uniref:ORF71 n=1 Tax=Nitrosopumilaceae spindle-shaped virus TaxID=3065433 RepID=A0AAT9J9T7_9VIRU